MWHPANVTYWFSPHLPNYFQTIRTRVFKVPFKTTMCFCPSFCVLKPIGFETFRHVLSSGMVRVKLAVQNRSNQCCGVKISWDIFLPARHYWLYQLNHKGHKKVYFHIRYITTLLTDLLLGYVGPLAQRVAQCNMHTLIISNSAAQLIIFLCDPNQSCNVTTYVTYTHSICVRVQGYIPIYILFIFL